jgi:hypothetical protein
MTGWRRKNKMENELALIALNEIMVIIKDIKNQLNEIQGVVTTLDHHQHFDSPQSKE